MRPTPTIPSRAPTPESVFQGLAGAEQTIDRCRDRLDVEVALVRDHQDAVVERPSRNVPLASADSPGFVHGLEVSPVARHEYPSMADRHRELFGVVQALVASVPG
jgi:hypothetical protein